MCLPFVLYFVLHSNEKRAENRKNESIYRNDKTLEITINTGFSANMVILENIMGRFNSCYPHHKTIANAMVFLRVLHFS